MKHKEELVRCQRCWVKSSGYSVKACTLCVIGMWLNLVEHGVWGAEVAGSNPVIPTYGPFLV